ncbi:CTLH/CRA C-terminal to lish motif domain-containing protein [Podospora fimiseda]|uniref:CTLH/CRA C-terminal to lish motif domain-containing protein n=1 Tax=Podospora fimiseda TaxID=252190 RepID=A0AAN7H8A1_9PEZI|nr:CTLH/CRA C-terminal to lish motif domain-containing protein [Podospora fimiseda]
MADFGASKINHDSHLLLDQPLLRLPYELLRKNFRSAHVAYLKDSKYVTNLVKETAGGSINGKVKPQDVVKNLDLMLAKMRGLKRKIETYSEEENRLYRQSNARVSHLRELSSIHTVDDVKYEQWSRNRLDRLVVDYMLRHGYIESASALAKERDMSDLVDIDTFVNMSRIRQSLLNGSVNEALAWCNENKKELRALQSNLDFMLRTQQYIEMMRTTSTSKMLEAVEHAKKYITPFNDTYPLEVQNIAGLLAFTPDTTIEPYVSLYSPARWQMLADIFTEAHLKLLSLPNIPLLHVALSSGLSALKTPACHSHQQNQTDNHNTSSLTTSVCPICSTELNALARNVPYAHHSKSHLLEHDLVLLPNGRVYGRSRLDEYAAKSGLPAGQVKDLVTGELFSAEKLRKVFIT